jgi:hypothetical protein
MSALGQKRTCAVQKGMSALPLKADISNLLSQRVFDLAQTLSITRGRHPIIADRWLFFHLPLAIVKIPSHRQAQARGLIRSPEEATPFARSLRQRRIVLTLPWRQNSEPRWGGEMQAESAQERLERQQRERETANHGRGAAKRKGAGMKIIDMEGLLVRLVDNLVSVSANRELRAKGETGRGTGRQVRQG